ncbi:MAG: hypothetical protein H0V95_13070 [Actinobacteria bacterium]|nr:hypothetical protein [Actinomycetota bacterium]
MREFVRRDVRAALVPWLVARTLVGGALGVARYGFGELEGVRRPPALDQGLFAWDAAFYRDIAEHGYGVPRAGLRFFPLVPLLARNLGTVLAGNDALALLIIANLSALAFGALLYRLTLSETADPGIAMRAVWFAAVLPPALTLVMGYAEATFLVLSVAMFLALRARRWWWATAAGFFAGLARPAAALLAIPAAIEGMRGWRTATPRDRVARAGAVISPVVGTACYLVWVGREFGDAWLPIRLQSEQRRRGGFADPFSSMWDGFSDLFGGDRFGSGLHVVWALAFVALAVVLARWLPASYTAYAGATVLFALSAENLDSLERYAMSAFPLAIGVAIVTPREELERPAVVLAAAGLVGYSVLAFLGRYVP